MRLPVPSWETFQAGVEAAEEIAAMHGVPLTKADPPILGSSGFEQAVRTLVRALAKEAGPADKAAVEAFAKKLDRDWEAMSAADRATVIASAAKSILGVPELIIGKVRKVMAAQGAELVKVTKREVGRVHRIRIDPSFTAKDQKIVDFAAKSQGNYITTRYRDRARMYEQRARDIVSDGVGKGLGRKDIGAILKDQIVGPALRTADAYWEVVAATHVARARSWGQLSGFAEAEIETFEVEAVLDEVTTDQCRFLNGRRFNVNKAIDRFNDVEASEDPEAVKKLQPWIRVGQNDDGDRVLFVQRGDKRTIVADVHESGVGVADKIGSYKSRMADTGLQNIGISTPPYHGNCRTTIVPL